MSADADRRLDTIRNLLAKAEATSFPDEAEAFFAKASELIARYSIDEAALWADMAASGRERPDELQIVVHSPYLAQKSVLIGAVAAAHGCRALRIPTGATGTSSRAPRSEIVSIVGFPSDLRWVETLATSLLLQLTAAMLAASPSGLSASQSASWRRSFIVGFAEEVGTRLEHDRRAAAAQSGAPSTASSGNGAGAATRSVELVLVERAEEVDADFRRRHPRVRTSYASGGRSGAGRRAGRSAGAQASFGRRRVGGRRSIGTG